MGAEQSSDRRSRRSNISTSNSSNSSSSSHESNPSRMINSNSGGPGAYRMAGGPRNQRFYVTVPRGVRPGQHFAVLVNGQQMMVRCPEGQRPGSQLIVTPPSRQAPREQQYIVTVPENVRPGQQFRVNINNHEVMVTCPNGVGPNQRVTFQLPLQQQRTAPTPNNQMFEVTVPDGVRPGQPFALIANGQRVMVTCPPDVGPGKKIRFELPVKLSETQLESHKVDYDKDGWVRALGVDLKYHWMYSRSDNKENNNNTTKSSLEENGLVRTIDVKAKKLKFINAKEYATETSVEGTQITYTVLSDIAGKPFSEKEKWLKEQFNLLRTPWEEGHMKIKIRRSNLLEDAVACFDQMTPDDLKKIFRFEFIGEPGLDAGGVAREFFEIASNTLFNPDAGLFLYSAINQMCVRCNPISGMAHEDHLRFFRVAGRIMGKALFDAQLVPVHLVRPLYKHLMAWPIVLSDIEHVDDDVYKNLCSLLDMDDISILGLDFSVTEDRFGEKVSVDLINNGSNIDITEENLTEYLESQVKYRLLTRVHDQLFHLLSGFYDVVPEPLLSVFDFQELELLMHGLPDIDLDDWKRNTEYTGDFINNSSHRVVQWFWDTIEEMPHDSKAKTLQFVTGTSGVPSQGFSVLQGNDGNIRRFTVHGDHGVKVFPRAHTCFNRIDLPIYKSKKDLKKYLNLAISMEATGFGIE